MRYTANLNNQNLLLRPRVGIADVLLRNLCLLMILLVSIDFARIFYSYVSLGILARSALSYAFSAQSPVERNLPTLGDETDVFEQKIRHYVIDEGLLSGFSPADVQVLYLDDNLHSGSRVQVTLNYSFTPLMPFFSVMGFGMILQSHVEGTVPYQPDPRIDGGFGQGPADQIKG